MSAAEAILFIGGIVILFGGLGFVVLRRIEKCTRHLRARGWDEW